MIDIETARQMVLDHTTMMPVERRSISSVLGYVLAQEIVAREPIPLFDMSAMDGYAVRTEDVMTASDDVPVELPVQGMIQAGDLPKLTLQTGHTIKIFTGSPVPSGADAVVMKEYSDVPQDVNILRNKREIILVKRSVVLGENIRPRGGEFAADDKVFPPGTRITPPVIGMLATLGYDRVDVYRKPTVALIITGNEIEPITASLELGQIRDSNSYALSAALEAIGYPPVTVALVRDIRDDMRKVFADALRTADVVISVGGVSVGDYDMVRDVWEELGARRIFWRVAMKPGKPNYFAVKDRTLIFGLPGNPVSALVSFCMFVKPALNRLFGLKDEKRLLLRAQLNGDLRKTPNRLTFVRGVLTRNENGELSVTPTSGQESHMVGGLAYADCLIHFPQREVRLERGSIVDVEPLHWCGF